MQLGRKSSSCTSNSEKKKQHKSFNYFALSAEIYYFHFRITDM